MSANPIVINPIDDIDKVIMALDAIVDLSIRTNDRKGYFAALYNRITRAVRENIAEGKFDDNPRMERLDVIFANRYLAAYEAYTRREPLSKCWLKAFEAAEKPGYDVLQHLLVAMNAHINLDLGIAAARVCPGPELAGLKDDFDKINGLLASQTPLVEKELDEESPGFKELAGILPQTVDLGLVGLAMDGARVTAWDFAVQLAPLSPQDQLPLINSRDDLAASVTDDFILCDGGSGVIVQIAQGIAGILHYFIDKGESTDIASNIRILAQGEMLALPPVTPVNPLHPGPLPG